MVLKIHITLLLALLYNLYIGKKEIFFIAYLFVVMHELAHMIMALLLKVDIEEITLLPFGTTAKYKGKINIVNEFLIAIAGPIASYFFAFAYHNNIYLKINLLILIFNLLPIYPLDGGRMIKTFLIAILGQKKGNQMNTYLSRISIFFLLFFAMFMFVRYQNISFLLLSLYVLKIHQEEIEKDKIRFIINYLQIDK